MSESENRSTQRRQLASAGRAGPSSRRTPRTAVGVERRDRGGRASDESAFSGAYHRHLAAVSAYVIRRCSGGDSGDIVSETFLIAWRRWAEVPAEPETRPWLIGVARNLLSNENRRRWRQDRLVRAASDHLTPALHHIRTDTRVAERTVLDAALQTLSEEDQELVLGTAWDGLTTAEMAIVLGISAPSARQRLHRARRRLRLALAERDIETPIERTTA